MTDSLLISLRLGILSAMVAVVAGTLGAIGLSRLPSIPAAVVSSLSLSPLIVPPLVLGVALLQMFAGMKLNGMFVTLVLGHSILTLPYVIRTVGGSVKILDRNMERAALDLGASWIKMIIYVTLPSVRPGILAGLILAFLVSFDNVALSLFLAGPETVPLPIRLYNYVENALDPMIGAISTGIIGLSLGLMYIVERLLGIRPEISSSYGTR